MLYRILEANPLAASQGAHWQYYSWELGQLTHPACTSPCTWNDLQTGWTWDQCVSGIWVTLTDEEISWILKRVGLSISPQEMEKLILFSRDLTIHFSHLIYLNLESCLQAWATLKLKDVNAVWSSETWCWEDSRKNEQNRKAWSSDVFGFLLSKSLAIPPFLLFLSKHSYLLLVPLEQQSSQELWSG